MTAHRDDNAGSPHSAVHTDRPAPNAPPNASKASGAPNGAQRPGLLRRLASGGDQFSKTVAVTRLCLRGLAHSDIPRMAAALSYRTIFSIVPVLVVAAAILGAIVSDEELRNQIGRLLELAGISEIMVTTEPEPGFDGPLGPARDGAPPTEAPPTDSPRAAAPATEQPASAGLATPPQPTLTQAPQPMPPGPTPSPDDPLAGEPRGATVEQWITDLVDRVRAIPLSAIGGIGLMLVVWAAMGMLVELERAFDSICGAGGNRPWRRRITTYWTALTLGVALLLATFTAGRWLGDWVTSLVPTWRIGDLVERSLNLSINAGLLVLAYTTVPNAPIRLRPAIIGALIAGVLFETAKSLFTLYVAGGGLERLYGQLALLPLFMLWVYVTWAIVLLGLQIAYALQHFDTWIGRFDTSRTRPAVAVVDPSAGLAAAVVVARHYQDHGPITAERVAATLGLPELQVSQLLANLADAGLLIHAGDPDDHAYAPATLPGQIPAVSALAVTERLAQPLARGQAADLAERLAAARRAVIAGLTLADLAADTEPNQNTNEIRPKETSSGGETRPSPA